MRLHSSQLPRYCIVALCACRLSCFCDCQESCVENAQFRQYEYFKGDSLRSQKQSSGVFWCLPSRCLRDYFWLGKDFVLTNGGKVCWTSNQPSCNPLKGSFAHSFRVCTRNPPQQSLICCAGNHYICQH